MNQTTPRTPSSLSARIALRLAVGVVAFMALGGPSPGYIGGCSRTTVAPDAAQFCSDRRIFTCARDLRAARITPEEFMTCFETSTTFCAGRNWTEGCIPTQNVLVACISALQDESRDATLTADIVECQQQSICPGSATGALTVDPHGI